MKIARTATAFAALPILGGLGLGLGLTAQAGAATSVAAVNSARSGTAATAAARSNATGRQVAITCENKAAVRPGTFTLACGDGNDALVRMTWTSWTPRLASGYGTETLNDCLPNCAEGKFRNYPVNVVFWGSAAVKGNPAEHRYTYYTLIYPGPRPPYYSLVNGKVVTTYPVSRTSSLWP
ncbi:MAG TPA: hypothetical protein VF060_25420 [Trebonia sp.]